MRIVEVTYRTLDLLNRLLEVWEKFCNSDSSVFVER